jgi:hypothetical protein
MGEETWVAEDFPETALHSQAGPRAPAIRFHLWHLARAVWPTRQHARTTIFQYLEGLS